MNIILYEKLVWITSLYIFVCDDRMKSKLSALIEWNVFLSLSLSLSKLPGEGNSLNRKLENKIKAEDVQGGDFKLQFEGLEI